MCEMEIEHSPRRTNMKSMKNKENAQDRKTNDMKRTLQTGR